MTAEPIRNHSSRPAGLGRCPGDKMIDWVSPPAGMRPLSLAGKPSRMYRSPNRSHCLMQAPARTTDSAPTTLPWHTIAPGSTMLPRPMWQPWCFTLLVSTGHEASAPRWPTGATAAVSLASAPRCRMAVDAGRARQAEDCGPGDRSGRPFHRPSAGSSRGARTAPHDRMVRAGRPRTAKPPVNCRSSSGISSWPGASVGDSFCLDAAEDHAFAAGAWAEPTLSSPPTGILAVAWPSPGAVGNASR
jgi:hypothetical protein